MENEQRIKFLEEEIKKNVKLYYTDSDKTISDIEFDLLVDELTELKPNSEVLKLMEVNFGSYEEVQLPFQLYSHKKIKSLTDYNNWIIDVKRKISNYDVIDTNVIITPKYDGIHLMADQRNFKAYTRGSDGIVGFDVTKRAKLLNAILKGKQNSVFGGEVIISNENFEKYFKVQGYLSPRNIIQGLFSADEDKLPKHLDKVDYIRYSVYNMDTDASNKHDMLYNCNLSNTNSVPYKIVRADQITEKLLDDTFNLWNKEYTIDGLVIEFNSSYIRSKLGYITKYPQYARAYKPTKYNKELRKTYIKNIKWQVSRYGKLTPVAEVESVEINNGIVSNVSLYNAKNVVENNIHVGLDVDIYRSGSINPKIENYYNTNSLSCYLLPKICPSCGGSIYWDDNGVDLYCVSNTCDEKLAQQTTFFFKTLGIKEFSLESIRAILKNKTIKYSSPADFLDIDNIMNINVEGIGEKTKRNLINQITKLKNEGVKLEIFQEATGYFEGLSKNTLKILNKVSVDLQYIYNDSYYNEKIKELTSLPDIGLITAETYLKALQNYRDNSWMYLKDNIAIIPIIREEKICTTNNLDGLHVCFTGFRDDKLKIFIENNGGHVYSSVTKKCNMLLAKDIEEDSSKTKKAKEYGIEIVNVEEFKAKFNESIK